MAQDSVGLMNVMNVVSSTISLEVSGTKESKRSERRDLPAILRLSPLDFIPCPTPQGT